MRNTLILLTLASYTLGCTGPDRTILAADESHLAQLAEHRSMAQPNRLSLTGEAEPGQRLTIVGRLTRKEDGRPIPNHPITAYQADAGGSYHEAVAGVESSARLKGVVRTDTLGRFLISTVVPGDYGSTSDNRHIHLGVPNAKPDAYDFFFKQYINAGLLAWAQGTDQAILLDLRHAEGGLVASGEVVVRGYPANGDY